MDQPTTSSAPQASQIRQNYPDICESLVNKQIGMELRASYVYLSMAYHFDRDDVAAKGCFEYFKRQSDEEREHALMFMTYQNLRGGRIALNDVAAPPLTWKSHVEALEEALKLEKAVNESILTLSKTAKANHDWHLKHFVNSKFATEQVESISEISKLLTNARRCGDGLGAYQFDRNSMATA